MNNSKHVIVIVAIGYNTHSMIFQINLSKSVQLVNLDITKALILLLFMSVYLVQKDSTIKILNVFV